MDSLFIFRKFLPGDDDANLRLYHDAALDKLQTLYPGKRLTIYDLTTIGIETDSMYSDTGLDTYELGLVDGEIPAIRNQRDQSVITFRI